MQLIDLTKQRKHINGKIEQNINNVLNHGKFILGPEVFDLEEKLCNYIGTDYCITCSSGTDALMMSLMCLGIGRDDEVITSPFSFISSAEVIALLGAKPVFVDIEIDTFNLDFRKLEEKISKKTKAIIPVSLFGQCANFTEINKIAKKYNIPVIEDGAQSFGAELKGVKSGNLSNIGVTSFFPTKPLGCYGDGGAIFTKNKTYAEALREIRAHGQIKKYVHSRIGINGRLDTLQAAILLAKLEIFDYEIKLRNDIGKTYSDTILSTYNNIMAPKILSNFKSVFAQYTIRVEKREMLQNILEKHKVPNAIYYPKTLNKQSVFAEQRSSCYVAERIADEVISIPMHPYLEKEEIRTVLKALEDYNKNA